MRSVLVIALLATGCATEPTGQKLLWSVTADLAPTNKPCEWPADGLHLHVMKDLDGVYHPDPSRSGFDEISIWQVERPERHAIDLEIDLVHRDGDVQTQWALSVDWTTEHERIFRGSASQWQTSVSTGVELCDSPYSVYGYVYLI